MAAEDGIAEESAREPAEKVPLSAYLALKRRLQVFVDLWVETGSSCEAVRRMGFRGKAKSLNHKAWRLRHMPGVREAYAERQEEAIAAAGITHLLVVRQLARIARFDHRKLFDEAGKPLPIHQLPEEVTTALLGVEVEELFEGRGESREHVGRVHKYRVASQVEALKLLMQYLKLIDTSVKVTDPDGKPLTFALQIAKPNASGDIPQTVDVPGAAGGDIRAEGPGGESGPIQPDRSIDESR